MHPSPWKVIIAGIAILAALCSGAEAQWANYGEPIGTGAGNQYPGHNALTSTGAAVCKDGAGGLICAYLEGSLPGAQIRINRLDPTTGDRRWGTTGISVTGGVGLAAGPPHVVSDGNRGCWVAWIDDRAAAPGLYVQRYNQAGSPYFPAFPSGVRIGPDDVTSLEGADDLDIAVTPSGKLLIALWDGGLRLQRLSGAAGLEWGASGALASSDAGSFQRLDLVADGEAAIVVWEYARTGQPGPVSLFANRTSTSGVMQWGAAGTVVFSAAGVTPSITHCDWDGSSLFVSWAHYNPGGRPGFCDVRAQRLNSSGVVQWGTTSTGMTVLLAPDTPDDFFVGGNQTQPQIVADGAGGCIIGWVDYRDYNLLVSGFPRAQDIYGQRLDASGAALWTANGKPLDTLPGSQTQLQMCSDGAGGAMFVYQDLSYSDYNIRAQHRNPDGNYGWAIWLSEPDDGSDAFFPTIASDGASGLLAAWQKPGTGTDCWGTHIGSGGSPFEAVLDLTYPAGGESVLGQTNLAIAWTSNLPQNIRLQYSLDGGPKTFIALTANDGLYNWSVPNLTSSAARMYVEDPLDGTPADSSGLFVICGALTPSAAYGTGTAPNHVVAGDFNEDGIGDLAAADLQFGQVSVLLGAGAAGVGNGTFGGAVNYLAGTFPRRIAVGDFNEDGRTDLAVSHQGAVAILLGNGTGSVGDGSFGFPVEYLLGSGANGISLGDFNEDGVVDMAVAISGAGGNVVSVKFGLGSGGVGNGAFGPATDYAVGTNPQQVVTGDFDEDGILDLAVSNNGGNVSVLLGNGTGGAGDGTFAAAVSYAAGTNPRGLATGDFDRDGITDLAVTNLGSENVSILRGNGAGGVGNGTFGAPSNHSPGGTDPWDVMVGDFTSDGIADLAVTMSGSDELRILTGTGSGGFTSQWAYAVGDTPYGVAVGDFLEDDRADLAVSNSASNNLSVLLAGCGTPLSGAVQVMAANGGELWTIGSEQQIAWSKGAAVLAVNVEVSRDDGVTWETVATDQTGTGFAWTVTPPTALTARVRVYDPTVPNRSDTSDLSFRITDGTVDVPGLIPTASFAPGRPNPFRSEVRLALAIPERVEARVQVFDVSGRAVATLLGGPAGPGPLELSWDGRDAGGALLEGGVYFVRARWPGFEAIRTVVRLR